jgi:glycosyltransferase involved in cell wall biosynthesis
MSDFPRVSIITPAYNQGDYLAGAMRSVQQQTFGDFEHIIVNDGSTDHTHEVANSFVDARIRYIRQENKGLSGARNTGIQLARGTYVLFLDADDWLLPDALACQLMHHTTHPGAGLSVGGWRFADGQERYISDDILPPPEVTAATLLLGNPLHVPAILLERCWLDKAGLFDQNLRACEDWDMWLRLVRIGCTITTFAHVICAYRTHEGQMTREPGRMRTAMLTVLDKVYSATELPPTWQALKDKAYAAAYLKAAGRAYHTNSLAGAQQDLAAAVRLDPSLLEREAETLRNHLAGWALAPGNKDARLYLERAYSNLPDTLAAVRKYKRREVAKILIHQAVRFFEHGEPTATTSLTLSAIRYQPGLLLDRRTMRMLGRSILQQKAGVAQ